MTSWLGLFLSFFSHALKPKMTVLLINCFLITSRWPHWNGLMVYMEFNHAQFLYWTLAINIHIGYVRKKRSISSIGSINKGGNLVYTRCEKEVYNVCLTFPIFCSFERSCCSAAYLSTASSSGLSSISSSLRVGRIHFTRGRFPRRFPSLSDCSRMKSSHHFCSASVNCSRNLGRSCLILSKFRLAMTGEDRDGSPEGTPVCTVIPFPSGDQFFVEDHFL